MTGRPLPGSLMAALAVVAGVASGCTTESTPVTDTGPAGKTTMTLAGVGDVTVPNGGTLDGLCVAVPDIPDPTIPITVAVTNLDLRPAGYCAVADESQCGHLLVRVNGVENSQSATPVALVHLGKLGNPYADLTVTIDAVNDSGAPLIVFVEGSTTVRQPLLAQVKVNLSTRMSCPAATGADGG